MCLSTKMNKASRGKVQFFVAFSWISIIAYNRFKKKKKSQCKTSSFFLLLGIFAKELNSAARE